MHPSTPPFTVDTNCCQVTETNSVDDWGRTWPHHVKLANAQPTQRKSQSHPAQNQAHRNQWFNIIINSTDVLISDLDLEAKSLNGVKIANSDGWDTYRSDRIVIQDSVINNTDGTFPLQDFMVTFSQLQIVYPSSQTVQTWLFRTSCAMALMVLVLVP